MSELTVSQEFLNNYREAIANRIQRIRDFFGNKEENNYLITELSRLPSYRKVKTNVERHTYANLRTVKVAVPPGMSTDFLTYLDELEQAVAICENILPHVLIPFNNWLAEGLIEPAKLKRISRSPAIRNFEPHDVDGAALKLGECFEKGRTSPNAEFGQAFARIKDVEVVYKKTDTVASRFSQIDRKQIFQKSDEISVNLEKLITRIEEDPVEYELSKSSVDVISKMSYTVAQEIEFYSSIAYHLTQQCVAIIETTERLKKA